MPALNASQVKILQVLAANKDGLTRADLEAKCNGSAAVTLENLGTVSRKSLENHPDSLHGLALVKPLLREDEAAALWVLSASGVKAARAFKTRARGPVLKVPASKLVPAVKRVMKLRTYGLELLTDADLKEIRASLGADYAEVGLADLRQQAVNARKQGRFSSPDDKLRASLEKCLREFGPEGTVIPGMLTETQVKTITDRLAEIDAKE